MGLQHRPNNNWNYPEPGRNEGKKKPRPWTRPFGVLCAYSATIQTNLRFFGPLVSNSTLPSTLAKIV